MSDNSVRNSTSEFVDNFLKTLGDEPIDNLHEVVMAEVEKPMLEVLMKHVKNNQSKAAIMLGLSRGTTRKKLKAYGFI
jgi:Fis family transcriptional regulator, factor for inversion stimulation protein